MAARLFTYCNMDTGVIDLRCEYHRQPLGVDRARPRLFWRLQSDERGTRQWAYRVLVASSPEILSRGESDLWDSGIVSSGKQSQLRYDGRRLNSRERCYWKVGVQDREHGGLIWSDMAQWSMGLLDKADWSAQWIGVDESSPQVGLAKPRYLRRNFELSGTVARATVYVTSLGLYELRINGGRVGDHLLAPEWTNYHRRVQYQVYDVTDALQAGANCIAAVLGNGWYCGGWQHWESELRPIYGTQPYLLAQLEIETAAGEKVRIVTDSTWFGRTDGPLRFAGIYEGETYDATQAIPGWDLPHASDEQWQPVTLATPRVGDLVWQRSEPIRVMQDLPPRQITEPRPGVFVFDFGQNIAGWCRVRLSERPGTTVTLRHNEVLKPDGTLYLDNLHAGHLSTGDRQVLRYTCAGGSETYEPRFSYQGFRYVEVSGLTAPPDLRMLTARVIHTSFDETGEFECSNTLVNRLSQNIAWSQRANFMGVPTDCPQRDERCGYTGDANFFVNTAVYNFDVAAIFNKWLVDVCLDSQRGDGGFADHAPDYGKGGSQNVGWADAGVTCVYRMYRTYGDIEVIRDHYTALTRFLQMLVDTSHGTTRGPDHVGLGDWLNLGGGASKEAIGTAYYGHCFHLMAEMAHAIGETDDARSFADHAAAITRAFAEHFIDEHGRVRDSSQTGYALAFTMGLVPPAIAGQVANRFVEEIEKFDGKLATGFIGTPRLLPALYAADRAEWANRLLLERRMPSWLFPVENWRDNDLGAMGRLDPGRVC